ncbi:hypothetical protein LB507_011600 [Fusarium sp. FIESC RH6]|nr:hypothetical protein LB507_011600 [Fusarium sp. FIESC RH6]
MEPIAKRQKTTSGAPRDNTIGNTSDEVVVKPYSEVDDEQDRSRQLPLHQCPVPLKTATSDICFGMLYIPTLKSLPGPQLPETVEVHQDGKIFSSVSGTSLGSVRFRHAQLLDLFRTEQMDMDLKVSSVGPSTKSSSQYALQVILYGDKDLSYSLKEVLRNENLFLQDPYGASRDAIYWNPQKYYHPSGIRTSHFYPTDDGQNGTVEEVSHFDSLAAFTSSNDMPETEPTSQVQTTLKSHQKQALSFMISRERGWNLQVPKADLWSLKQDSRQTSQEFINNISGLSQYTTPPDFRGGILVDNMGCGKTLSMIALIAYDVSETKTTLVVVPPSLLDSWRRELLTHLNDASLVWAFHHGSSRISSADELQGVDIVLTTYPTAVNEWRKKGTQSVIFSHDWHRTILDEAHYIKNPAGETSKVLCHIQAARRWAVTGTPFQNSTSDIQSILRFLNAYPYSKKAVFDEDIGCRLQSGPVDIEEAVNRLKCLLNFLMLRRSVDHCLPARNDFTRSLKFNPQELEAYKRAAKTALISINDALQPSHDSGGYVNTLQKINVLRHICNLGGLSSSTANELEKPAEMTNDGAWDEVAAQIALDLQQQPRETKSIVFSFWKSTLDLAHVALKAEKIACAQVDGTVPASLRPEVFERFRSDNSVQVLLLSLSCGAVGLTLTAASRAYLMEPQWNPAIEEQALSRIHRIGQTKSVTTVRFIMDNSIEQYVVEVQNSKRDFITVLMSPRTSSLTRELLERIRQCVRRSLA